MMEKTGAGRWYCFYLNTLFLFSLQLIAKKSFITHIFHESKTNTLCTVLFRGYLIIKKTVLLISLGCFTLAYLYLD